MINDEIPPKFLKEHQEVVDQLRASKAKVKDLEELLYEARSNALILRIQANGGTSNPRDDFEHPGHILILLGWKYSPSSIEDEGDPFACNWRDPENKGPAGYMSLVAALGIACRYLLDRRKSALSVLDRLIIEED